MTSTIVLAVTPLDLPDPEILSISRLPQVVAMAQAVREECRATDDMDTAQELRRRLDAFTRYVKDRQSRSLLAAETRRTEVLLGELLGPAPTPTETGARKGLPYSNAFSPEERNRFRTLAAHIGLVEELLAAGIVSRPVILERIARLNRGALPVAVEGAYTTLTADPPWRYSNRATRAAAEDHYETLTAAQVCDLSIDGRPVVDVAAENAHLYLWTTNGFLREAFDVMAAWGFTYKTLLTWVKPQLGIGNYFRSCTEHVLFGVRGNLPVQNSNQPNWFEARRGRHSKKPHSFYDLVELVSPGPYLELFGRTDLLGPRPNWTVWGDEA